MAYNATNPVTVGAATKKDHYDRVFDNTLALYGGAMALPSQAALDLLKATSGTQLGRVPVGASLQYLRVNSGATDLEWAALGTVLSKTGNYSVAASDGPLVTVLCSASGGAFTVTLPPASGNAGQIVTVKKTDSSANAVTVDGNASETIDGVASVLLYGQHDVAMLLCDGTGWRILDSTITIAAHAHRNTAQTISSGVVTKVQLNTELFDTANAFDAATNHRFTVPTYGRGDYDIHYGGSIDAPNGTTAVAYLYKNGGQVEFVLTNGLYGFAGSGGAHLYLADGDYLEVYVSHTRGSNTATIASLGACFLSVRRARGPY
ncbi:MAG: hypothetical protein AB7Q16_21245 [Vicinamibacterales bacterium]